MDTRKSSASAPVLPMGLIKGYPPDSRSLGQSPLSHPVTWGDWYVGGECWELL